MDFSLGRVIKNDITGGPFRLGLELCETRQFKFFFFSFTVFLFGCFKHFDSEVKCNLTVQ